MDTRLLKCTKVTVCILATAINKELHSKSVSTYYLSHELIDKGIHKVWLSLLSVNDGHGVKGHCVVVLKCQQLCYLPQMSSRLLGQRFVGLEELRYGIRVLLLRDTVGRIMMSWLHHQIWFLATILTQYEVNLYWAALFSPRFHKHKSWEAWKNKVTTSILFHNILCTWVTYWELLHCP